MSDNLELFVLGAKRMYGKSAKNNDKDYSFANLSYLVPSRDVNAPKTNISSAGYEVKELGIENLVPLIERFKAVTEYPCYMELLTEPDPENPTNLICYDFQVIDKPIKKVRSNSFSNKPIIGNIPAIDTQVGASRVGSMPDDPANKFNKK